MSNEVTTGYAKIESYRDDEGRSAHAFAQNAQGLNGFAMAIRLGMTSGDYGSIWLCNRRAKDPDDKCDYVLLLSSSRWEQDARDAGFTLVQKLSTGEPSP